MQKLPVYILLTVTMGLGAYIPTLWGASAFGGQSVLASMLGGIVGIWLYVKLRRAGYLE